MIKNIEIFRRVLGRKIMLAIMITSPLCYAQNPVTVKALAVHYAGNIQYSYQVTNLTRARSIVSVSIGNRGVQLPDTVYTGNAQPELTIYPAGSYWGPPIALGDNRGEALRLGGTFASPPGWSGSILEYGETTTFSIDWKRLIQTDPGIPPGQTFSFGVVVPPYDDPRSAHTMSDPAYLNGHFTVAFGHSNVTDEGPAFWTYTGLIAPIDTTPPTLSVTLNPTTLWPPDHKLVAVTADIAVKDDYDPAPEVQLVSITANEALDRDDVRGANPGTDSRKFLLRAERGIVYTVTYSATDSSGNKSTASAKVTVPRDRDDKEPHESLLNKHSQQEGGILMNPLSR